MRFFWTLKKCFSSINFQLVLDLFLLPQTFNSKILFLYGFPNLKYINWFTNLDLALIITYVLRFQFILAWSAWLKIISFLFLQRRFLGHFERSWEEGIYLKILRCIINEQATLRSCLCEWVGVAGVVASCLCNYTSILVLWQDLLGVINLSLRCNNARNCLIATCQTTFGLIFLLLLNCKHTVEIW